MTTDHAEANKKMQKALLDLFLEPIFKTDDQETALQCLFQMGNDFTLIADGSSYAILLRFRGIDLGELMQPTFRGLQNLLEESMNSHRQAVIKCDLIARTVKSMQEMRTRTETRQIRIVRVTRS